MSTQRIRFVRQVRKTILEPVVRHNVFSYTEIPGEGIQREIRKLCFWVLRKLGAFHVDRIPITGTFREIVVDTQKFLDRFFAQLGNVEKEYGLQPRVILMGCEDYEGLMDEGGLDYRFSFNISPRGREFMGLKVHVIPWMKGILVLPGDILS